MKSFSATTMIRATPDAIWGILTDVANWTSWNSTVTKVEGRCALGDKVTVHAKISPNRSFPVKVAVFEAPTRMAWSSGMPLGLFKGERTFTLTAKGEQTEFSMREAFTGPLSGLIGRSIPDLQPDFEQFAADLKKRAESA